MNNVFNHFYQDYDDWYKTKIGQFVDQIETACVFSLLQPEPAQKILEVGCGTGNFTHKLAQKGCLMTGIDCAPNMLKQAQIKLASLLNVNLLEVNAEKLPFDNNHFESSFSVAAFEFMQNPLKVYQEMYRVTKPGGNIVICTIQKHSAWADLYESPACKNTAYEYAHFLTAEQVKSLDEKHFIAEQECLFIPPNQPESDYNLTNEEQSKLQYRIGGFICLQFRKSVVN